MVRGGSEQGRIQSYNRIMGYSVFNLSASYNDIIFKQQFRMTNETLNFLCQQLAPSIFTSDSKWRKAVPVDTKVAIALTRLASKSPLYIVVDTFGVGVSTVHKIILEFCHALEKHCRDVFIRWPSSSRFKDISQRFEALHEIPYIVGAIDGSHIPIIAPAQHAPDYYCRKSFHSVLLQGIVDSSCCFWDYDVGWCGSILYSINLK